MNSLTLTEFLALELSDPWHNSFVTWLKNLGNVHTQSAYLKDWQQFLAFVELDSPSEATQDDVVDWMASLASQWQETTVNRKIASLSSFYTWAIDHKLTDINPCDGVKRPKFTPYGNARWLEPDEVKRLLASLNGDSFEDKRDKAIILMMLVIATRRMVIADSETAYRLDHDKLKNGKLTYPKKGGGTKTIALPDKVWEAVQDYFALKGKLKGAVFTDVSGKALDAWQINYIMQARGKAVGIEDLTPHVLRHTAIRRTVKLGKYNTNQIMDLTDHGSIRNLMVYMNRIAENAADDIAADLARELE